MRDLESKLFFASSEIEPRDMRQTPAGFFTALTMKGLADDTLIVGVDDTRFRIVLQPGIYQFNAYKLSGNDMYEKPGFLIPASTLSIEGDRTSAYDASRLAAIPGDIALSNGEWSIAATDTNVFRDTIYLRLWGAGEIDSSHARIGFKNWRIVSGEGTERRVVYERQAAAGAD